MNSGKATKILIPGGSRIHEIAANAFNALYSACTGNTLEVIFEDDKKSDLLLLGSDTDNIFVHELVMKNVIPMPRVKVMSDAYEFIPAELDGRKIQIFASGRPRALLYAVYRFFELKGNCRYFWDGDILPAGQNIPLSGFELFETPRFKYRGQAYCPHRSLKRFQPEQWDYEDWTREIDYILKKRFNVFWIRIGIEDIFQKAFPDIVEDHLYECPGAPEHSYDDRRLFWPLQYKAELRKKVLDYAFERDLLHPEEAGAFTHWDTYTPKDFMDKVKPLLVNNAASYKFDTRHLHWDIRLDENLDNYFKVTQASIDHYGKPYIFYVRGISERSCYKEHEENIKFKIYCYKRIISKIRSKYPYAEIWFHNWDLMCNAWNVKDVQELLSIIDHDPNIHMLSFTNDCEAGMNAITEWGVPHTFPYLLGFFVANMPQSDIRGAYDLMETRMAIAKKDPMCHGLLLWPEASHVDNFIQDYISVNAWSNENIKAGDFLETFCNMRYICCQEEMKKIWEKSLRIIRRKKKVFRDPNNNISGHNVVHQLDCSPVIGIKDIINAKNCFDNYCMELEALPEIFRSLAGLAGEKTSEMTLRDIRDLGKTVLLPLFEFLFASTVLFMESWKNEPEKKKEETILKLLALRMELLELFYLLLAASKENSLYDSLLEIGKNPAHEYNRNFEEVLKGNAENAYCRGYIAELVKYCYIPEGKLYCRWVKEGLSDGVKGFWKRPEFFDTEQKKIKDSFMAKPLKEMAPDVEQAAGKLPETFERLALCTENILQYTLFIENLNL